MGRGSKIAFRTLGAVIAASAVLAAVAAVVPRLAGTRAAGDRIAAEFLRRTGGTLTFDGVDLVLFPRPGVIVRGPAFAIPGKVAGTAESMAVYPEFLPLLAGTFRVARIDATGPALTVEAPERLQEPAAPPLSLAEVEGRIAGLLADAASRAPGVSISAHRGSLDLARNGAPLASFRLVEGRLDLPPRAVSLRVACRSDLFERLSATATLDPGRFEGRGTIELSRFRPGALAASLFPGHVAPGADAVVDLAAAVRADGFGVLDADLRVASSSLALSRGDRRRTVTSARAAGTVRIDRGASTVVLRDFSLGSPRLALAGRMLLDRATPRVELDAEVREADLSSARDVALALAGDVPSVRTIFGVVRGGMLSSATVRIRAATPEGLADAESIAAGARLADGSIRVPGIGLDLASVTGDVSIAGGVLRGRRLATRVGRSRGRDGSLTLGLSPGNTEFRLDTLVHADVSELPSLLSRLVRNAAVRDELSRIEGLGGEADGRLILGDSTASVKARVDVSEVRLSGRYRRIPFPVVISRGAIAYDGATLRIRGLAGTVGASSVSGLAAAIGFGPVPSIEELSGTFSLDLGALYPWLASAAPSGLVPDGIARVDGTADLSVARLSGPLLRPVEWRYAAAGEVRDVAVATTPRTGLVAIDRGRFRAGPEEISFTGVRGRLLDASLSLSGSLRRPGSGGGGYDLALGGIVGPGGAAWISDLVGLPPGLRPRSAFSLTDARVSGTAGGENSFSGTLGLQDGPTVALLVRSGAEGLAVERLAIRDAESDAAIALRVGGKVASLKFSGTLTHGTAARMFTEGAIPRGRLSGDIEVEIPRDRPWHFSARGAVEGRDLAFPTGGGPPLAIDRVVLEATGNAVRIGSAPATWAGQRLVVAGELAGGPDAVRLDLDVASDRLEGDSVLSAIAAAGAAGPRAEVPAAAAEGDARANARRIFHAVPVTTRVRLEAGTFTWGGLAWSPFRADVALSADGADVSLADAAVCGIATSGTVSATPRGLSVDLLLLAVNQDIGPALACLGGPVDGATGRFSFRGRIRGQGAPDAIARNLEGEFSLEAGKGRIHALNLLSNLLAVVNVTEVFRGKSPGLGKKGFAFNSMSARGRLAGGRLVIEDGANIDGASMGISAHGTVDVIDRTVDMVALVAPLRTVDAVIRRIPVLRYILGGSLVSIPVGIRGSVHDPKMSPLPASAVGAGMLGILERTLKAPVKIVEPVVRRRR